MPIKVVKTVAGKKIVIGVLPGAKSAVADAVPSNKPQTLTEKSLATGIEGPTEPQKASPFPIPFIDKISIVITPADEEDAATIHSGIWTAIKDKEAFVDVNGGKWGEFRLAKKIALPSVLAFKKLPLFQYAYVNKTFEQIGKAVKMRLEFVPVDLGSQGMDELHAVLTMIMPNGWNYVIEHGRVTRLDVAVDFPKVLIDDFQFLPKQGASTKEWRVDGKLTGYTHGKKNGNHTAIYDRKEKRKAAGTSWKGKEGMRIERRLKNPPIKKLTDLPSLPNPFADMSLTSMPEAPPSESVTMPYVWELFKCAVQVKGLTAALALLPQERRTLYRKHFKEHTQPWWDPKAIWANWPVMLDDLGIASASAWP